MKRSDLWIFIPLFVFAVFISVFGNINSALCCIDDDICPESEENGVYDHADTLYESYIDQYYSDLNQINHEFILNDRAVKRCVFSEGIRDLIV